MLLPQTLFFLVHMKQGHPQLFLRALVNMVLVLNATGRGYAKPMAAFLNDLVHLAKVYPDVYSQMLENSNRLTGVVIEKLHAILAVTRSLREAPSVEGVNVRVRSAGLIQQGREGLALVTDQKGHSYRMRSLQRKHFRDLIQVAKEIILEAYRTASVAMESPGRAKIATTSVTFQGRKDTTIIENSAFDMRYSAELFALLGTSDAAQSASVQSAMALTKKAVELDRTWMPTVRNTKAVRGACHFSANSAVQVAAAAAAAALAAVAAADEQEDFPTVSLFYLPLHFMPDPADNLT